MRTPVVCEPLTALAPDHAPEAVQAVAFVADQLNIEALPLVMELGLAVRVMVGAAVFTETVADCSAVPPVPEQASVKVALALSAPVDWEPLRALPPDQAPEAVQLVAEVEDHVRVALPPLLTALGPTLRLTVGKDALTDTVVDCAALPPGPVQVST